MTVVRRRRIGRLSIFAEAVVRGEGGHAYGHVLRPLGEVPSHALALSEEDRLTGTHLGGGAASRLDRHAALQHERVLVEGGRLPGEEWLRRGVVGEE